jgi:5-formyltetrahydrofolate cyclo-ligase
MYDAKQALREAMLKTRNSLSKEMLDSMSETIQVRAMNLNEFMLAKIVAVYHPIGSEVDTLNILSSVLQLNKHLVLPRVEDDIKIIFTEVKDLGNDLQVGKYKIMEPKNHCLKVNKMDLVFVPGIAWDKNGHRLGYGKGYYDRYLRDLHTINVGLAYDFQILEDIPHEKNDLRVDLIVTEKRVIKTKV